MNWKKCENIFRTSLVKYADLSFKILKNASENNATSCAAKNVFLITGNLNNMNNVHLACILKKIITKEASIKS